MLLQFIQILYVLVAIAIIAFVLLQQGSGAQAGSGFGGGASATVFGARGASNFLSKSTKWLAITFFVISMGMAMYASRQATRQGPAKADLGVMAQQQAPAQPAAQVPTAQVPTAAAQPPAAETQPVQPAPAPGQ
ncbi:MULTISPECIES: preprotein translocase subunit SecG [Thermomonas]|jgi:preprotein translocase subunit SecG|uniref:preprotein translocase subunit SecG n=1 Tax=Thermomonas TaxID=141948 RepID=UPI0004182039|nr:MULTISPECIES: preprotein translocase subunit SecG [Thermomonas]